MQEESALAVTVSRPFEQAVMHTRIVLRSQGFRILSEMPAPPSLGEGVGRSHLFLSVWERPTSTENLGGPGLDLGDHLSCSVVVYEQQGAAMVAALDPTEDLEGWQPELAQSALDALTQMLDKVAGD